MTVCIVKPLTLAATSTVNLSNKSINNSFFCCLCEGWRVVGTGEGETKGGGMGEKVEGKGGERKGRGGGGEIKEWGNG